LRFGRRARKGRKGRKVRKVTRRWAWDVECWLVREEMVFTQQHLRELPGIKAVHSSIETLGMAQTHGVLFVNQELLTGGLDG
jgi:hypothetical protein